MSTVTAHFNFYQPAVGDGILNGHTWGLQVNDNFDAIDDLIWNLTQAISGSILPNYSAANGRYLSVVAGALTWVTAFASDSALGMVKLATAPDDPTSPVAVGDNDLRLATAMAHAARHAPGGDDAIPWKTEVHGRGTTEEKPAAAPANAGYLYFDTDTDALERSNGSEWEPYGGAGGGGGGGSTFTYYDIHKVGTPSTYDDEFNATALDAKWTQVHFSIAAAWDVNTTVPGCLYFKAGGTGGSLAALQAMPPSGDFTIWTEVDYSLVTTGSNAALGLVLSTTNTFGTGNQACVMSAYYNNYAYSGAYTYSGFGTNFAVIGGNGANNPYIRFLRIRRVGSTYYFGWSPNGKVWNEVSTGTLGFTPAYFGVMVDAYAQVNTFAFEFFRHAASGTAVLGGVRTVTGS